MIDMLKLVAFVYLLQLVPCVHAGDLINSGPAHGMAATAAWLTIAALTSRLGGADAQYYPSRLPHPGGETFGNDEIYEACRVVAHTTCHDLHPQPSTTNCKGFDDPTGYSYKFYQLGCQNYNQGYGSTKCCGSLECAGTCFIGDGISTATQMAYCLRGCMIFSGMDCTLGNFAT